MRNRNLVARLMVVGSLAVGSFSALAQDSGPPAAVLSGPLPVLTNHPRVDKPVTMTVERQAVRKVIAAAETLAMENKAKIDASLPPGQMTALADLHKVVFAAVRHGEGRVAQRLAAAERVGYHRLILLVQAVEAYEASGESVFASKLAAAVGEQIHASQKQYRSTGVWFQIDQALRKLLRDRAAAGDAETAMAIVRRWPEKEQWPLLETMAEGFAAAGDRVNATAIYSKSLPVQYEARQSLIQPRPGADPFGIGQARWQQDLSLARSLLDTRPQCVSYIPEVVPQLSVAMSVLVAQKSMFRGDAVAAVAELVKASKAVDASGLADGYRYGALAQIARLAAQAGDLKMAGDAVQRAGKLAAAVKPEGREAVLTQMMQLQAMVGDEAGLKQTLAEWTPRPGTTMDRAAMEKQVKESAARSLAGRGQPGMVPATRPSATQPATRPAVAAAAVDAEIATVLKSPTTIEQKMMKLIELADSVAKR